MRQTCACSSYCCVRSSANTLSTPGTTPPYCHINNTTSRSSVRPLSAVVQVLPKLPGSLLAHFSTDIAGVTSPMMYIGQLFSTFAWHVEDHYMYSINYSHVGAHKTWYGVPASDADGFEQAVLSEVYGPAAAAARAQGLSDSEIMDKCLAALIKKTTILSPGVLLKHGKLMSFILHGWALSYSAVWACNNMVNCGALQHQRINPNTANFLHIPKELQQLQTHQTPNLYTCSCYQV